MGKYENIKNMRFSRLLVLDKEPIRKGKNYYVECICDCGKKTIQKKADLKRKVVFSCGCYGKEKKIKHGTSKTKIHKSYSHVMSRCYNKKDKDYKNYGGRGIYVCEEWKNKPLNFYNWAKINGHKDGLTIDRIDNNKGYSPDNCRWVDRKTQNNNRRSNVYITFNGQRKTKAQWCDMFNVSFCVLNNRIRKYGEQKGIHILAGELGIILKEGFE